MRDLGTSLIAAKNSAMGSSPWCVCADLELPAPDGPLYLNNVESDVYWGDEATLLDRRKYEPGYFKMDMVLDVSSGQHPKITAQIFNTVEIAWLVTNYSGFDGIACRLAIVFAQKVGDYWTFNHSRTGYALSGLYEITGCSMGMPWITLTLGKPRLFMRRFPARICHRDWCDFAYQESGCWMEDRTEAAGEPTTCDHTYEACKEHWTYQGEATTGIRFGGWPTVGRGAYVY